MCFDSVLSVKSLQVDYHIGKQKTELIKKKTTFDHGWYTWRPV